MGLFDWLFLQTKERASCADILPESSIFVDDEKGIFHIDVKHLNIPFTEKPHLLPLMIIPDTNSMDGVMDAGNNCLLIQPADSENNKIMADWIAKTWLDSKGMQTVDAVYRVMVNPADDVFDFFKPSKIYAIHRVNYVGQDKDGRYFYFKGVNNPGRDPFKVRDNSIMFLKIGVID